MQRIAPFICLMIGSIGNAWSAPPQSARNLVGWRYYGRYQPTQPQSLAEIPESIRLGIIAHLRARLGGDFYRSLEFTGGQVVDIDELHQIEPGSTNWRWEVPAYDLHFTFHMPQVGLDSYTAQIQLRKDGTVLHEINLPDFATDPGKLKFTTLASAVRAAESQGFDLNKVSAEVVYDLGTDALMWHLVEVSHDDGLMIQYNNIDIRVDSGNVAKVYTTQAIR